MKILAVSDEESASLWDYYQPEKLDPYDLILSCGDLKASYLTFLVTMGHARLLYVRGNHDDSYASQPPEGCDDIDGHLVTVNGVRILGLGGSIRYSVGDNQYTEKEMLRRVRSLRRAIKKAGGVDLIVTHAPPRGYGDLEDPAHLGFSCFLPLIDLCRPQYLLHGHTHPRYCASLAREHEYHGTRIVNVGERRVIEIPDGSCPPQKKGEVIYLSRHKENDVYFGKI